MRPLEGEALRHELSSLVEGGRFRQVRADLSEIPSQAAVAAIPALADAMMALAQDDTGRYLWMQAEAGDPTAWLYLTDVQEISVSLPIDAATEPNCPWCPGRYWLAAMVVQCGIELRSADTRPVLAVGLRLHTFPMSTTSQRVMLDIMPTGARLGRCVVGTSNQLVPPAPRRDALKPRGYLIADGLEGVDLEHISSNVHLVPGHLVH